VVLGFSPRLRVIKCVQRNAQRRVMVKLRCARYQCELMDRVGRLVLTCFGL
jgi:hypothetical protein